MAREGEANAPAYRGIAYIVFERLALAAFGNRMPQLSFEIQRSVERSARQMRGVVIIPGSGEFAYATGAGDAAGRAARLSENVHSRQGGTDWKVSVDQLEPTLPNAGTRH